MFMRTSDVLCASAGAEEKRKATEDSKARKNAKRTHKSHADHINFYL